MENQIPMDAKIAMQQFLQEQKIKEALKAQVRIENPKRVARQEGFLKQPLNSRQLESYARSQGFAVVGGNGRHGVHLVSQNGYECPSVRHGGGRTLANGTKKALIRQIQQNSVKAS